MMIVIANEDSSTINQRYQSIEIHEYKVNNIFLNNVDTSNESTICTCAL